MEGKLLIIYNILPLSFDESFFLSKLSFHTQICIPLGNIERMIKSAKQFLILYSLS